MTKFLGSLLLFLGLIMLFIVYGPLAKQEVVYRLSQVSGQIPISLQPVSSEFGIVIPKLNINAKIIKNVDPYDSLVYQKALTQGVAHALGTSLPGERGNIFIFSHSSSDLLHASLYNSIFYLLPKLTLGDQITLYYLGIPHTYTVTKKYITDPSNISVLEKKQSEPTLTLMTCYPPGTDLLRYIVEAQ